MNRNQITYLQKTIIMAFIKFPIKSVQVNNSNRITKVRLSNNMCSQPDGRNINDMVLIQAALSQLTVIERNNQFTYTFPFKL